MLYQKIANSHLNSDVALVSDGSFKSHSAHRSFQIQRWCFSGYGQ